MNTNNSSNTGDFFLKIQYWFVTYKSQLRKWWVIAVLAGNLIIIFFVVVNLYTFFKNSAAQDQLIAGLSGRFLNVQHQQESSPKEIAKEGAWALATTLNKYTLVAKIKNPNQQWALQEFQYHFVLDDKVTPTRQGFILPGQEKYLIDSDFTYVSSQDLPPQKVSLVIDQPVWQRITDLTLLKDISFKVAKIQYSPTVSVNTNTNGVFAHLAAEITNQSVYGFNQVGCPVVLLNQDQPVAADYVVLDQFKSLTTRDLETSWRYELPSSLAVLIQPEVNILVANIFMP